MEAAEKECGALGGLFQAIVNDMKVSGARRAARASLRTCRRRAGGAAAGVCGSWAPPPGLRPCRRRRRGLRGGSGPVSRCWGGAAFAVSLLAAGSAFSGLGRCVAPRRRRAAACPKEPGHAAPSLGAALQRKGPPSPVAPVKGGRLVGALFPPPSCTGAAGSGDVSGGAGPPALQCSLRRRAAACAGRLGESPLSPARRRCPGSARWAGRERLAALPCFCSCAGERLRRALPRHLPPWL